MEITENEAWLLSYYRESELAGALLFGKLARRTRDDELRIHLTEHCAEEAVHAWLWTQTLVKLGATPYRVSETYQSRYCARIGIPKTILEVLALTQVFEKRVMRQFSAHRRKAGTHPEVVATLKRMMDDEVGHIDWVRKKLDECARKGEGDVEATMKRFEEMDAEVYREVRQFAPSLQDLLEVKPC